MLNNYTPSGTGREGVRLLPRFVQWLLVLSLSLLSCSVYAELPEFYGKKFARMGQGWADVRPPAVEIVLVIESENENPDKAFQLQLEEFESKTGPYADGLTEPLLGLGRYYSRRGDYEQALQLYRRALHIVRLNDGLNSKRQAPVVRELLDTVRLSGDLQALDDRYDYFFRLYGRGRPPYNDIRVRAALEYLRWQREALRLDIDNSDSRRLLELYALNEDMLDAAVGSIAFTLEDRWNFSLGQIRNLYLLQSKVNPPIQVTGLKANAAIQSMSGQDLEMDSTQRQLQALRRNAFRSGRGVLEHYLASMQLMEEGSEQAGRAIEFRARAMLELADLHQWNGSYSRAAEYYNGVVEMLIAADRDELVQQWFGAPVELPDNGAFWQPAPNREGMQQIIVSATYDVSARGRARNISAQAQREDDAKKVYRFKRGLASTRFRPRFENGQAVATQALSREYVLYN
jgi:tetratricopeptide (TPR) repeat protein